MLYVSGATTIFSRGVSSNGVYSSFPNFRWLLFNVYYIILFKPIAVIISEFTIDVRFQ